MSSATLDCDVECNRQEDRRRHRYLDFTREVNQDIQSSLSRHAVFSLKTREVYQDCDM